MEPWLLAIPATSTLLAALGGYWLAGRNEEKRDQRASERGREERRQNLESELDRSRHDLQLQTLLELQDALQTYARNTMRIVSHDHMRAREGRFTLLPEGYSDDMQSSTTDVRRLRSRVLDDDLRAVVEAFEVDLRALSRDPRIHYLDATGATLVGDALERAADAVYSRVASHASRVLETTGAAIRHEISWSGAT